MTSRAEELPWTAAAQPRLPSMDAMDYVMHSMPDPPAPRLQHPPTTGSGTCPYSHRVDHGSPLPSPHYNSVSSMLSPVRTPGQPQHSHSNSHSHSRSQQPPAHSHSHSHSLSQSHQHAAAAHHPYDPVHPPAPAFQWFSQPPTAPQPPPHWGQHFGLPNSRSAGSGSLFASQQLPSLFPIDHHHHHHHHHQHHHHNQNQHHQYLSGSGAAGGGNGNLGPGSTVSPLLVSHHGLGQPQPDPFAPPSWSMYRGSYPTFRMSDGSQRYSQGGSHAQLGSQPVSSSTTAAVPPTSLRLPNPSSLSSMPDQSQSPPRDSQHLEIGSGASSSASSSSSARASPTSTDRQSAAQRPLESSGRSPYRPRDPQTPTQSEPSSEMDQRQRSNVGEPASASSSNVSPPSLDARAAAVSDDAAGASDTSRFGSAAESAEQRATTGSRRAQVEVHLSDDESDSSEDQHMEEMFIQQLGVAGPPFAFRMSDLAEERIRRQQILRGAITNKRIASKSALASLQSVEIESLPENERTCVICYNEFGIPNPEGINEAPLRLPKCKHVFGDHCIKKWFEESDSCPYCRDKVPSEPLLRINARSVGSLFMQSRAADPRSSGSSTGTAALGPDGSMFQLYRGAANPYAAAGNARAQWQATRRSPPEDIDARSRRTRPRHGSLRGASSAGSSSSGSARPNSFGGGSSSTPASQQGSPGRERYFPTPAGMNAPIHWQLHSQMDGRRMSGQQPPRQPSVPTPAVGLGAMPYHTQHRQGQASGTPSYSTSPLTASSFPNVAGQSHMSMASQDAGFVNPLSGAATTDSTGSMVPVAPAEAGAPFPGPGSATPPFPHRQQQQQQQQPLPPVGGLDNVPFDASATTMPPIGGSYPTPR